MKMVDLILAIVLLFAIIIVVLARNRNRNRKRKGSNLPPGGYGWPIIGETLDYIEKGRIGKPEAFIKERVEKYKSMVFKTHITGNPVVFFCGREGNKFLYSNENKLVQIGWPNSTKLLLGNALTNLIGEEARLVRRVLHNFVTEALIKLHINTVDRITRQHIQNHWKGKQVVEGAAEVKLYTFELACYLFMSLDDPEYIAKLIVLFSRFLKGVIALPIYIPGTRHYRAVRAADAVRKQLLGLLHKRRLDLHAETASPTQDLLSHLLTSPDDNGKFMSETQIVNNILLLLFAGHDTSSVTLTLTLKVLSEQPDVYKRVLQEQMEIAHSKKEGELLQWEDIQKMKYSWNVVSEVMRLYPPIQGAFRQALVDFTYAGYDIPKGMKLYWNPFITQHDPQLFPDNTRFDPARFEGSGPAPFTYVAFGGGPRMCIGKDYARVEILLFLHNLIKEFSWSLVFPDDKIIYDPMPAPVHGLALRLLPHNNNQNHE